MGFAYIEPTLEELNRRIATGQIFIQSDLSGEYREYYVDYLPSEIVSPTNQPIFIEGRDGPVTIAPDLGIIPSTVPLVRTGISGAYPAQSVPVYTPGGGSSGGAGAGATWQPTPTPGSGGSGDLISLGIMGILGLVLAGWSGGRGSRGRVRTRGRRKRGR